MLPAIVMATVISGGAAVASFEQTSADGCVVTSGELAAVQAQRGGELADGLYVVGVQEDVCAGTGNGFAGFAEGEVSITGLGSAHFAGAVVAESYSGGAPVTFELDLTWTGTGAVSNQKSWFRDEGAIEFSYSRSRVAVTSGQLDIDGSAATVTSALIGQETSGQIFF